MDTSDDSLPEDANDAGDVADEAADAEAEAHNADATPFADAVTTQAEQLRAMAKNVAREMEKATEIFGEKGPEILIESTLFALLRGNVGEIAAFFGACIVRAAKVAEMLPAAARVALTKH